MWSNPKIHTSLLLTAILTAFAFAQMSPEQAGRILRTAEVESEPSRQVSPAAYDDGISVYFSPNGGCTDAIIREIEKAEQTIKVQAYYFTSAPIAKAMLGAKRRGVTVTVVLDSSQQTHQYSSATFFHDQGVPVFIDSRHGVAHNKIILIDDRVIITGSFNFIEAAEEENAENLVIIENKPDLMAAYLQNFEHHLAESDPYKPLAVGDKTTRGPPQSTTTIPPPTNTQPRSSADTTDTADSLTVYITRTGKKYHGGGCRYLRKSKIPIRLDDAKARGYGPCFGCRPPN